LLLQAAELISDGDDLCDLFLWLVPAGGVGEDDENMILLPACRDPQ
jgi:hypothetical protein